MLSKNIKLQSFFYIFYFKKGKGTQSTKLEITNLKKKIRTLTKLLILSYLSKCEKDLN